MNKNNKYVALARREFWEHRGLWLVPVIAAGLMLCAALFGALNFNSEGMHFTFNSPMPPGSASQFGAMSLLGVTVSIGLFASIVIFVYLLDCLFSERKDRSILFWKSLPVSDAETVLAKLAVALVLVPLLVLVLTVLLQPLLAAIVVLRVAPARPFVGQLLGGSFSALPQLVGVGIVGLLWYAPVASYMMLASVLAKRAPIMYAVLPPVVLCVAERLVLGTTHVLQFVGERLAPWPAHGHVVARGANDWATFSSDWWKVFALPGLWFGLLAAAAMIYVVIRLRRYRDDT